MTGDCPAGSIHYSITVCGPATETGQIHVMLAYVVLIFAVVLAAQYTRNRFK